MPNFNNQDGGAKTPLVVTMDQLKELVAMMKPQTIHVDAGANYIDAHSGANIMAPHTGATINLYQGRSNKTDERPQTDNPLKQNVRHALNEVSKVKGFQKAHWWAVWKVMMERRLVTKSAREFGDYLVAMGITEQSVYNNIRQLDARYSCIARVQPSQWWQADGKCGDDMQQQIDTAQRFSELMEA